MRTGDLPFLALSIGGQDKGAFSRPNQYPYFAHPTPSNDLSQTLDRAFIKTTIQVCGNRQRYDQNVKIKPASQGRPRRESAQHSPDVSRMWTRLWARHVASRKLCRKV